MDNYLFIDYVHYAYILYNIAGIALNMCKAVQGDCLNAVIFNVFQPEMNVPSLLFISLSAHHCNGTILFFLKNCKNECTDMCNDIGLWIQIIYNVPYALYTAFMFKWQNAFIKLK